jgi:hypothetical protein
VVINTKKVWTQTQEDAMRTVAASHGVARQRRAIRIDQSLIDPSAEPAERIQTIAAVA